MILLLETDYQLTAILAQGAGRQSLPPFKRTKLLEDVEAFFKIET
jgi:hypothetical protein